MKVKKRILWYTHEMGEVETPPATIHSQAGKRKAFVLPSTIQIEKGVYRVLWRSKERTFDAEDAIEEISQNIEEMKKMGKEEEEAIEEAISDYMSTITSFTDLWLWVWDNLNDVTKTEAWEKIQEGIYQAMREVLREKIREKK